MLNLNPLTGDEWGSEFLFDDLLPVNIFEPYVLLDLIWAVEPEPVRGLPLYQLVNEVCGLQTPSLGQIGLLQHDLLLEDLVADLLPRLPDVRSAAHHEFVE